MISLDYEPCSRKRTIHVIALAIDGRIDLVREAIITLVPLESDIVRGSNAPQGPSIDLIRRLPDAQVIS